MAEEEAPAQQAAATRRRDWDGVAAVIAALVGLLALVVSAYTANIQRQQVRAQVWTRLVFARSDSDHSLIVANKGVGPARVESVRLYVDGKPQQDWAHVFAALKFDQPSNYEQSSLNGGVLAAGERLDFLKFSSDRDWASFTAHARGRLKLRACYCSVLDECLLFDQLGKHAGAASGKTEALPVDRCERVASEEFDN